MEADKGHLHHRLMQAGLGQRRAVLTLYGIGGIMGVAAVLFSRSLYVETLGLVAVAMMYIYVYLTDANHAHIILKAQEAQAAQESQEAQAAREAESVKTENDAQPTKITQEAQETQETE